MVPAIAYGNPHFECCVYFPDSKTVIDAVRSVFRANCAEVPPPAPQPIITICFVLVTKNPHHTNSYVFLNVFDEDEFIPKKLYLLILSHSIEKIITGIECVMKKNKSHRKFS